MKYCIVILDGAAGWPLDELGSRTTLQAARTPHLDELAQRGRVGLAQTVPLGAEPSSSAACTSILGYDPVADFVGRGAIEAASMGITLEPGEVALRMNLVNTEGGVMASYSCGHISSAESRAIVLDLGEALGDDTFRFYPGVSYRHILVVKGHPELLDVSYTPPHDFSGRPLTGRTPTGAGAEILIDLMERARPVLERSAPNRCRRDGGEVAATDIWPFWPGARPSGLVPFGTLRGVRAAMTSGVDLLNGLSVMTGIDRLDIPGVTDGPDNDYAMQAEGALKALRHYDLVIIHVETPDEAGHAGDVAAKIAGIEAIDREVVARIGHFGGDLRVLCMPDHPTPIALKTHVGEPVPFVLAGTGIAHNGASTFDEEAAKATGSLVDPGHLLIEALLSPEASA
ncbi:MAG: cofactor-independent phosphoglycerate mutase [Coriobacteriia bacterium]|nr:cofactor-independent phosphoglycerate mutase [Coriobacteriia bacterium]